MRINIPKECRRKGLVPNAAVTVSAESKKKRPDIKLPRHREARE
jgi:hypothetical protein